MRSGRSSIAVLLVGLVAATASACGGSKKETPLTLKQRLLRSGEMAGYVWGSNNARTPAITVTSSWKDFLDAPIIPDAAKAAKRLGSLKADFVRASSVPLEGTTPNIVGTGGFSGVAQFRSPEAATRALEKLDLEGYSPCPEKCDVKASAVPVPEISGAKGVRRTGHAVDNKRPFLYYQVLFSDGPFLYGVGIVGQPPKHVHEQLLLAAAKKLRDRVKSRPPPS